MGKQSQKNWLMILTFFLLISSGVFLYISVEQQLGFKTCSYNGVSYSKGDMVSDYEANKNCVCNSDGEIECSDPNLSQSDALSDFTSTNLDFYYKFLNLLEKDSFDEENIEIADVEMDSSKLIVSVTRESLCTKNEEAPVAVGFYNFADGVLKLTTMTNRDVIYTEPCLVENKYEIVSLSNTFEEDFQIYFQTEEGKLFNLEICVDDNRIFSDGDVFQSEVYNSVCTCEQGLIVCE